MIEHRSRSVQVSIDYVAMTIGGHYVQLLEATPFAPNRRLAAVGQGVGPDTVFKRQVLPQTHAGSTTVAFMTHDGHYLEAFPGNNSIAATATKVGREQAFEETWLPDDRIALRTYWDAFVTAEGGGGEAIVTNRTAVGEWEKFYYEVIPVGLLPNEFRPGSPPHPGLHFPPGGIVGPFPGGVKPWRKPIEAPRSPTMST
jgi:hypothetical protein